MRFAKMAAGSRAGVDTKGKGALAGAGGLLLTLLAVLLLVLVLGLSILVLLESSSLTDLEEVTTGLPGAGEEHAGGESDMVDIE